MSSLTVYEQLKIELKTIRRNAFMRARMEDMPNHKNFCIVATEIDKLTDKFERSLFIRLQYEDKSLYKFYIRHVSLCPCCKPRND